MNKLKYALIIIFWSFSISSFSLTSARCSLNLNHHYVCCLGKDSYGYSFLGWVSGNNCPSGDVFSASWGGVKWDTNDGCDKLTGMNTGGFINCGVDGDLVTNNDLVVNRVCVFLPNGSSKYQFFAWGYYKVNEDSYTAVYTAEGSIEPKTFYHSYMQTLLPDVLPDSSSVMITQKILNGNQFNGITWTVNNKTYNVHRNTNSGPNTNNNSPWAVSRSSAGGKVSSDNAKCMSLNNIITYKDKTWATDDEWFNNLPSD